MNVECRSKKCKRTKPPGCCLVCSYMSKSILDVSRKYHRDVENGTFTGTWNEYQVKCKKERDK